MCGSFVKPLCYEDVAFGKRLKPGTYIFADLERLDDAQLEFAKQIWRTLRRRPESYRLLNDPSKRFADTSCSRRCTPTARTRSRRTA
jgi:hypothetical protein